jgi:hypothetical protein
MPIYMTMCKNTVFIVLRIGCAPPASGRRSRPARQLRQVPLEVLGRVVEQALEGHELAEVRVPPHRVVHAAAPVVVVNGVNLVENRPVHAIVDRRGAPPAEDDGLSARPERVDSVEERGGSRAPVRIRASTYPEGGTRTGSARTAKGSA